MQGLEYIFVFVLFILVSVRTSSQESSGKDFVEPPNFKLFREIEDYSYLRESEKYRKDIFDPIKFVPFNKSGFVYLSFGGQIRPRFEYFSNRFWDKNVDQNFYSQRMAIYLNAVLGKNFRIFSEFYSGFTTGDKEFAQDDDIAFFQSFIEYSGQILNNDKLVATLGRQELGLGAGRLLGIREGPNIRRSFDMVKLKYLNGFLSSQAFYGKEVIPLFGAFDNAFTLFDSENINSTIWGSYNRFHFKNDIGSTEFYYLGFKNDNVNFNDVFGPETRHTLGVRRFGEIARRIRFNTEVNYQFGNIDDQRIRAYSFALDTKYKLFFTKWKPFLGLKLEYFSGDSEMEDGKIRSFNPMFLNPSFYSLAATVAPINLISIHPSLHLYINKRTNIYLEWAQFWRNSSNDGLYRPPRFLFVASNGIETKKIGHQFGFKSVHEFNRHVSFDIDISYFIAGKFLERNDLNNNILHFAPTLNYRF